MFFKQIKLFTAFAMLLSFFTACDLNEIGDETEEEATGGETIEEVTAENGSTHEESSDYTWEASAVIPVTLNGTSVTENSDGVSASGSKITISAAGTYSFSGTLSNGQIIVDAGDNDLVRIILSGVNITCSNSAPINIKNSAKTIIVLADNSTNTLTDGTSYSYDDASEEEPNATIFSKSDLTIYGNGSLTIDANFNDGISCKDGLIIKSGTIDITAVDDGIRGKDYLIVKDGKIKINCTGDGLKSDNDSDSSLGYLSVEAGVFNITAGGDALTAETDVMITTGSFTLTAGGGSSKTVSADLSAKGIKGVVCVVIDGGNFTFSTADDAIHSNGNVAINGGTFVISSGDDGIHADTSLLVACESISVSKSYEGLESASITINSGDIRVVSSDDGINAAGGSSTSTGGSPGQGGYSTSGNYYLYINGGNIYVNAVGDGLDINGAIVMTAGNVIVNGPTSSANGALDYDSSFKLSGGFFLAAGSSGMAMAPSTTSTQNSILLNFSSTKSAGTLVCVQSSDGKNLFTFAPAKTFQSIAFSSSELTKGTSYVVYTGGSSTGTVSDGLYQNGTYTPGTQTTSFTVSGTVTKITSK